MQICKVCDHDKRSKIDWELVRGKNKTKIARKYGLPYDSVYNHFKNHLTRQLVTGAEVRERNHAVNVLDGLDELVNRAKRILDDAEEKGQNGIALGAIRELRGNFQLIAQVQIELQKNQMLQGQITPQELEEFRIWKQNKWSPEKVLELEGISDEVKNLLFEINMKQLSQNKIIPKDGSYKDSPSGVDPLYAQAENVRYSELTEPYREDNESRMMIRTKRPNGVDSSDESLRPGPIPSTIIPGSESGRKFRR